MPIYHYGDVLSGGIADQRKLQDCQEDRDHDASYEDGGDQGSVPDVLVGHVKAGEGGDEEADGYQEKKDLQG